MTLSPYQSGISLDIFVKSGPVLYDPNSITFSVVDANTAFQGSGLGHKVSIGHYDARNFIIPSSGAFGTWTITWSVDSTTMQEQFAVSAPSLSLAGDAINALDRMIDNIRIDIGDFDGSIFATSLLERYLIKAVMRLNRVLGIASGRVRPIGITPGGLGTPARIPAIVLDMDARTIYPDNDEIKDIIVLQAEVLVTYAEMAALRRASAASAGAPGSELISAGSGIVNGAGDGIMIRNADGVIIDTRQRFSTWNSNKVKMFLDEAKTREDELEKSILSLKHSFSSSMGKVVY